MRSVTVKNVPDEVHRALRDRAQVFSVSMLLAGLAEALMVHGVEHIIPDNKRPFRSLSQCSRQTLLRQLTTQAVLLLVYCYLYS